MRPRRLRFTIQRLMIAVAVVAIIIFAAQSLQRRARFLALAADAKGKMIQRATRYDFWGNPTLAGTKQSGHYRDIASKYEQAARYPWIYVSPDSTEPDL